MTDSAHPTHPAGLAEQLLSCGRGAGFVLTQEGRIALWSRGAELLFGFDSAAALGQLALELLVLPQRRAETERALAEALAARGGEIELYSTWLHQGGGALEVQAWLCWLELAAPGGFVGVSVRERPLPGLPASADSHAVYRELFEAAPDAVVVVDRFGSIALVNGQAEKLFGYERSELLGQRVEKLVPERLRAAHPRHRADFFAAPHSREMGSGRELYAVRKDGTEFTIEISLSPIETADGLLVASASRDVTERRRAQERFRDLLESAPDAMVIVDVDGRIALVNSQTEALFGYSSQELIGQWVELLVPERFRTLHPAHRRRYFADPRVRSMGAGGQLYGLHKDGSEFPVEVSLSPLRSGSGVLVSSAIRDVTARVQAMQAMERARAAAETARGELEAFSYSVAHDLRAPLRSIDGFTLALSEDYTDKLDAGAQRLLGKIRDSTQHMAELIDALLMLARVTQRDLEEENVDLSQLARAIAADLRAREPARVVEFEIAEGVLARGDPHLLGIALENLLGNAWKFTSKRAQARIEFGVSADPQPVLFVRDNGAGFDMAYAAKLFGVFQRLHAASEFEGTGIGLATVQRIVRRHGGRIWGQGAVDAGACFYFTLGTRVAR